MSGEDFILLFIHTKQIESASMAWVIYLGGIQDLHPGSESWLAEWGRVASLTDAKSAIERGDSANLVTLLPHGEEIEAYGSLEQWLLEHPSTHCTLVYPQPALAIAKRLQRGEELEAVCQHWKQQAEALLSLFRQRRRQLRLLSWPVAAKTSEGEATDRVPLPTHSPNDEIEPFYSLLARQSLAQEAELADVLRYLAASTHNATQCLAAGSGLSAILQRHRQELQQREVEQAKAREVAEAEHAKLHAKLKEERDALQQQRKDEQAQSEQLQALQEERDGLISQLKESEEENTLLLEQLHYVQEELERHILNHRDQKSRYNYQQRAQQQQELLLQWLRAFATHANCAFYKKRRSLLKEHKALLASSSSFDADWYARTYPDVAESGIEPATHYLKFGMLEGRNPSAEFDTLHYIKAHPDIANAGKNPLLHYIRWGESEQRQVMPKQRDEESS
ncbi:hypothetical protein [Halomonas urumqiensis]|uniref:Uncharacterized protein n=1 Tax=Halomonas urumqiensis TaxID=1684789 RepID=A0A2N7UCF2_9GAMM|nr:hypothetical protein [Halomonas urumqiensis]PMR78123.1 hypothetical protein C1H70_15210 [Halomonas urumqiensis]PTB03273.1 hypothetical protein C6V82_01850 [Halomonas urumqiensis]GHE20567.1 hypothetical protein GCM10017767_10880 [Halomonas urumqiensis]